MKQIRGPTWRQTPAHKLGFFYTSSGAAVPGAYGCQPRGGAEAVLVGHGGSRHKRDESTLDFIRELVENNNLAAAAIGGPTKVPRVSCIA